VSIQSRIYENRATYLEVEMPIDHHIVSPKYEQSEPKRIELKSSYVNFDRIVDYHAITEIKIKA
jgi:hypothetical protein